MRLTAPTIRRPAGLLDVLSLRFISAEPEVRSTAAAPSRLRTDVGGDRLVIDIVDTQEGFAAIEADWNKLFAAHARSIHVFQSYNWLWHTQRVYGDGSPVIATVRRDGELVLVWPMRMRCRLGVRILGWLGEPVAQYGDLIAAPEVANATVYDAVWRHVLATQRPDVLTLRRVRADSNVSGFLSQIGTSEIGRTGAPFVATDGGSFEAYDCQQTSKRHRKQRERKLVKLAGEYGARFDEIVDPRRAGDVARDAILLKRKWLADRAEASATLSDDRALTFFQTVASDCERPVGCRVHALLAGDELISAQILFDCKGRSALHVIVYDARYQRESPGTLHLSEQIKAAFAGDIAVFDFLAPEAPYKLDWATGQVAVADHTLAPTFIGWLYAELLVRRLRPLLKRLLPRLPSAVRRLARI